MGIADIADMSVAVVLILIMLVGGRGTSVWLHAGAVATKYVWLLRETAAAIATSETTSTVALFAASSG